MQAPVFPQYTKLDIGHSECCHVMSEILKHLTLKKSINLPDFSDSSREWHDSYYAEKRHMTEEQVKELKENRTRVTVSKWMIEELEKNSKK